MFITESINQQDSLLYLTCCRIALKEIVKSNATDPDILDEWTEFIMNEASDYQIMSMIVNESLPEEIYNEGKESLLFSQLKEEMVMNYETYHEAIGPDVLKNILFEVGSLYPQYSSSPMIAEFFSGTDLNESMYSELESFEKKTVATIEAIVEYTLTEKGKKDLRLGDAGLAAAAMGGKTKDAVIKGGKAVGKVGKNIGSGAATVGKGVAAGAKHAGKSVATPVVAGGKYVGGKAAAGGKYVGGKAVAGGTAINTLGKTGLQKVALKAPAGGKISRATGSLASTTGGGAVAVVGAAALAAAAIYAGVKVYKRFLGQAARSCKGQSGQAKTQCMNKFKANAINAQINATKSGMAKCSAAKNPEKCKSAIANRVASLQNKMAKYR